MSDTSAKAREKTCANLCGAHGLRGMRWWARSATSLQAVEREQDAPSLADGNPLKAHDFSGEGCANPRASNEMHASPACGADSLSPKALGTNRLRGFGAHIDGKNAAETGKNLTRAVTLVRWCKFNLVGAVGIFVQFGVLILLKSVLHFNYLGATALAVEAAVVHNFFWHERFTWADRMKPEKVGLAWKKSLPRFLRFNLTTGLVSIAGNLGMMRVMVGWGHMNYLAANGIAIVVCSAVNFLVSDGWVFGESKTLSPRIAADSRGS